MDVILEVLKSIECGNFGSPSHWEKGFRVNPVESAYEILWVGWLNFRVLPSRWERFFLLAIIIFMLSSGKDDNDGVVMRLPGRSLCLHVLGRVPFSAQQ